MPAPRRSLLTRFLGAIERVGNALPHPATLFLLFALGVIVLSGITARLGIQVIHPGTGEIVRPVSLLSLDGLHRILTRMVTNFTGFAPLGTVLVALLGIGVAEGSGLISAVLRKVVLATPRRLLTLVIVFAGVMSNVGSEIGYVLLIPLAASMFLAAGRHPIAGLAAAFAGVSGGYSANLLLGTVDPLLSGLTQEAARIIDPAVTVNPACNYYFMAVSTFFVTIAGTFVTERIVIPRLGEYKPDGAGASPADRLESLTPAEKRGLRFALIATIIVTITLLWSTLPLGWFPGSGFLRDAKTGELLHSPFLNGIVALIFLGAAVLGIAYGVGARTIRSDSDVMRGMSDAMKTIAGYLVLVFFAAQFVAYFNWTNLGLILAVEGADTLKSSGLGGIPLMICFVILAAIINLTMGSASAKWAVMAPVFVPMFMLLGYSPQLTQAAFRIGDSVTNIISPMMSYFALIVAFFQRYDKNAGIGTLVATMLPYSVAFFIVWILLLVAWLLIGLPLGPEGPLYIPIPATK